jgi:hypothetical protein
VALRAFIAQQMAVPSRAPHYLTTRRQFEPLGDGFSRFQHGFPQSMNKIKSCKENFEQK